MEDNSIIDEETYKKDHKVIQQLLIPVMYGLDEAEVDPRSFAIFLAHYLKTLLDDIDSKPDKEKILKRLLD